LNAQDRQMLRQLLYQLNEVMLALAQSAEIAQRPSTGDSHRRRPMLIWPGDLILAARSAAFQFYACGPRVAFSGRSAGRTIG
jgi:hypothetical protein